MLDERLVRTKWLSRRTDTTNPQVDNTTEITENAKPVLPENLPQDGELLRIITAWPTLPDELKKVIIKIIS